MKRFFAEQARDLWVSSRRDFDLNTIERKHEGLEREHNILTREHDASPNTKAARRRPRGKYLSKGY